MECIARSTGEIVMDMDQFLKQAKERLENVYGDRFHGLLLYGSEARGEAEPDSDIDLLVLLDGPVEWGKEIRVIINTLYDLQLEVIRPIHAMPVDIQEYDAGIYALYRNVQKEGVLV